MPCGPRRPAASIVPAPTADAILSTVERFYPEFEAVYEVRYQ